MTLLRTLPVLVRHDLRRLLRDRFLLGTSAYILVLTVAMRWALPWGTARLLAETGFDATPWLPLVSSYFVLVNTTVLTGLLAGFLLLETREERTLAALRVTPMPLWHLFVELGLAVVLVGTATVVVEGLILGVGTPTLPGLLLTGLLVAPHGLVLALLLATQAANKVEAFAVLKITSVIGLVPIAAFFLPEPVQLVAGVVPPYWACRVWWDLAAGGSVDPLLVVGGVVCSAAWIAAWMHRFLRVTTG
jgi:fluoroquinolone transport system permease protein